jgi:hypothetical protein
MSVGIGYEFIGSNSQCHSPIVEAEVMVSASSNSFDECCNSGTPDHFDKRNRLDTMHILSFVQLLVDMLRPSIGTSAVQTQRPCLIVVVFTKKLRLPQRADILNLWVRVHAQAILSSSILDGKYRNHSMSKQRIPQTYLATKRNGTHSQDWCP